MTPLRVYALLQKAAANSTRCAIMRSPRMSDVQWR